MDLCGLPFCVLSEYSPKQYAWAVKENYQVWIKTKRKKAKDLSRGSADQRRSKVLPTGISPVPPIWAELSTFTHVSALVSVSHSGRY